MNPDGGIDCQMVSADLSCTTNPFLDKLKVDINIFKVGTFKSAVEPYLGNEMSDAAKEANLAYLDVLWKSWKASCC